MDPLRSLCGVFLAAASRLVPAADRRDWRAEWEAELAARWPHAGSIAARLALVRRSAGAVVHAAWFRKEEFRMETLLQDVRFALRLARRRPAFTLLAVLTLGIAIGANTALFSIVNGTLLRPLPYPDPTRLVVAWETLPKAGVDENTPAPATYADWRARARTLSSLAAFTTAVENLSGDGDPARLLVLRASPDLLRTLGVAPMHGRPFRPDEDRPGGPRVVLLSHDLWARRYASDPAMVGRAIRLSGETATVVGVLPADVPLPLRNADAWVPLAMTPEEATSESRMLWVIGRLVPGATRDAATRELAALVRARTGGAADQIGANVESLDAAVRGDLRPDLLLVFAGTAVLLLIACANVATMLLAHGSTRISELTVRTALGASRARVGRQLLSESLVLGAGGAATGALLATWGVRAGFAWLPASLATRLAPGLDARVLAFTIGVTLVTTLVFGAVPALATVRANHAGAHDAGSRATDSRSLRSIRGLLVIAEVALAVLLVAAAGVLVRTFWRIAHADMGFSAEHVLTMQVERSGAAPGGNAARAAFYDELTRRVSELTGVRAVGVTNGLPLRFGGGGSGFFAEGRPAAPVAGNHRIVSGGYFAALGIPLLQGRTFASADREGGAPVAVVSRSLAERLWPGESALGRRLSWGPPGPDSPWITVIGIVGDVRIAPALPPTPHVYFSFRQAPMFATADVAIRVDGDPLAFAAAARDVVRSLDPDQAVAHVAPLDRLFGEVVARPRFTVLLMVGFAGLALMLATIGLFGVISFIVARRAKELGVRLAIGATSARLRLDLLREGLVLASAGALAGAGLAAAAGRWAHAAMPDVGELDATVLAVACAVMLTAALAASDGAARRVARINPVDALRNE